MNRRLGILLVIGGLLCGPLAASLNFANFVASQKGPLHGPVKPTQPAVPDTNFAEAETEIDLDQEPDACAPNEYACCVTSDFALLVVRSARFRAADLVSGVDNRSRALAPRAPPRA